MRTTLTLEDDLGAALKERARATGRSFKDVVNETLRRGLTAGEPPAPPRERFQVEPHSCGLRQGIDVTKLNQLVDDLEVQRYLEIDARQDAPDDTPESGPEGAAG